MCNSFGHACDDGFGDAIIASFTPACLSCLIHIDRQTHIEFEHLIEPCLSDGAVYEAPGPGSCDLDIEIYVSAPSEHLPLLVMARVERCVSRARRQEMSLLLLRLGCSSECAHVRACSCRTKWPCAPPASETAATQTLR